MLRSAILAGALTFSLASAAGAQTPAMYPPEAHTMSVPLPNGSTADIRYFGPVAPQVTVAMLPQDDPLDRDIYECYDAFDYFGHYSPCFHHGGHHRHRGHHGGERDRDLPPPNEVGVQGMPPQFVVQGDQPRGRRYNYMLITTAPDGRVCTQRTEWLSRGPRKEPLVTRTDVGEGCAALAGPPPPPPPPYPAPRPY